jgi:hypothetical protein
LVEVVVDVDILGVEEGEGLPRCDEIASMRCWIVEKELWSGGSEFAVIKVFKHSDMRALFGIDALMADGKGKLISRRMESR